jgi:hypothetical protein
MVDGVSLMQMAKMAMIGATCRYADHSTLRRATLQPPGLQCAHSLAASSVVHQTSPVDAEFVHHSAVFVLQVMLHGL